MHSAYWGRPALYRISLRAEEGARVHAVSRWWFLIMAQLGEGCDGGYSTTWQPADQSQTGETGGREKSAGCSWGPLRARRRPVASHHHLAALLAGLLGNVQLC